MLPSRSPVSDSPKDTDYQPVPETTLSPLPQFGQLLNSLNQTMSSYHSLNIYCEKLYTCLNGNKNNYGIYRLRKSAFCGVSPYQLYYIYHILHSMLMQLLLKNSGK